MFPPTTIAALTLIFVVACCVTDIRTRHIPNALSGSFLLVGLVLNAALFGFSGLLQSFVGAALCLALLIVPFAFGGIGGGDVKMMAAVGALIGPRLAVAALAFGFVIGGLIMVLHLIRIGRLREKLSSTWTMVQRTVVESSVEPLKMSAATSTSVALPYSIPLGLGTLIVIARAWSSRIL
ncbi:MAG TPA: A24 family peptidase [Terriglobales bacterium]|nr:A24 family peptidase [Terriglobales bacterium]